MLWRDRVIGWGNIAVKDGGLQAGLGYISGRPPRERRFAQALESELERLRIFLALEANTRLPRDPRPVAGRSKDRTRHRSDAGE